MRLQPPPFVISLVAICWLGPAVDATHLEWSLRDSPTTETLNGIASGENLLIAVGNAGTLLTSADGVIWTASASGTTADLYDVACAPPSCAISGRELILEWDGVTSPTPLVEATGGEAFTPVMPTTSSVWFGQPAVGFGFSYLFRYDRALGDSAGIVTPGPVLELCVPPGGSSIVFVTTYGDVIELDESFSQTVRHDQDDLDVLDLVAAEFSGDCRQILASQRDLPSEFRVVEFAPTTSADKSPNKQGDDFMWDERTADLPAGFEISCVGYVRDVRGGLWVNSYIWGKDSDERTRVFHFDGTGYRETPITATPESVDYAYDGIVFFYPKTKIRSGSKYETTAQDEIQLLTAVGSGGLIVGTTYEPSIFSDGFESGDLNAWSGVP